MPFIDQYIFLGANEGLYTLNLNEIHEASMELVHARRCTWLYNIKDVLMSLSGSHTSLSFTIYFIIFFYLDLLPKYFKHFDIISTYISIFENNLSIKEKEIITITIIMSSHSYIENTSR